MKLASTISIVAVVGAFACSHQQPPRPTTPSVAAAPTTPAPPTEAENAPLAPGAATIPNEPKVAPPERPAVQPAERRPITSSSNLVATRPESLPPVAVDPVRDQPETSADAESVREIRKLLAADKSLSDTARKITITAVNGRVRLTGQVLNADERAAVERAARKAANVIDVKNQVVVLQ